MLLFQIGRQVQNQIEVNRREFLVTRLAAEFALAVEPVTSQTISTDTNGLDASEVKIPARDGEIPARNFSRCCDNPVFLVNSPSTVGATI